MAKNQRIPIIIMSSLVCCLLFVAAYYFAYVPEVQKAALAQQQAQAAQKQLADALAAQAKIDADNKAKQAALRATLIVDSRPTGATVTVGSEIKRTPATFDDLVPGNVSVLIQSDGFQDYKQDVTVSADKPNDLGAIDLAQKTGSLALSSPQNEVNYRVTGPGDYVHEGQLPDKLDKLPVGDYQVAVWLSDWKLPPVTVTVHDQETVQKEIKFPYASATITSSPSGATVRSGRVILGKTPVTLNQLRPGDLKISLDLAPYTVQRLVLHLPEFGNVTKQVALTQDKDFIAACGMPMVWVGDGGFWAGKYEMRQAEFEKVAGYNPSSWHRSTKPVESISWDNATAFCEKLNDYERRAGKLPAGYHYVLPTESQWSTLSADADMEQAAMSRTTTLSSTQDAGYSEPNKYGIYDTLGNVWEWCSDAFDDKGNHTLRGGSWLSSAENFPSPDTRDAGAPKYADRFTGFRVVLVPQ